MFFGGGLLVWAIIWGFATREVIYAKGYKENWFVWGFFFGIIAFIVACCKEREQRYESQYNYSDAMNFITGGNKNVVQSSWICGCCGTINQAYTGTCRCGRTKEENIKLAKEKEAHLVDEIKRNERANQQADFLSESEKADALLKYKGLFDSGVITKDKKKKKKKELLGNNPVYSSVNIIGDNAARDYSIAEKTVLNIIEKYPNGASGLTISQMAPRNIAPKEISEAVRKLVEEGAISKNDLGNYVKN